MHLAGDQLVHRRNDVRQYARHRLGVREGPVGYDTKDLMARLPIVTDLHAYRAGEIARAVIGDILEITVLVGAERTVLQRTAIHAGITAAKARHAAIPPRPRLAGEAAAIIEPDAAHPGRIIVLEREG